MAAERKPFLLRMDPTILDALQRWADDDLRSLNGQIDYLLRRAEELARRYKVTGVPYMVINGKYTADVATARGQNELIALVNDLAARERKK